MPHHATSVRFRRSLLGGDTLFGSFVKTTSPHPVEILGGAGFDFVVIDEEHAPFDRGSTDLALLAARAAGIAAVVRVPSSAPERLLAVLDDGAAGVLVPHVASEEAARQMVAACRYSGRRGFSNSPRAGGYGARGMWDHVDAADKEVTVIAMIEDPEAIERIDAIVTVDGLDAVFVGRGDLGVALDDRAPGAPRVREATDRVIEAARQAGKAVCLLASSAEEARAFRLRGVNAFVVSSDQGFLRVAATAALGSYRSTVDPATRA